VFFVGDPMQSIYGFREAEVGLFLDIRQAGRINEVPVDSLSLQVNFRSRAGVVDWANRTFGSVMPAYEEPRLGAVSFAAASAWHDDDALPPVRFHAFEDDDGSMEAERVRSVVCDIRQRDPDAHIAVLVRARDHLRFIAPGLKAAGQRFQAVEIERLIERPVIQDLMALTRAISHPADRTAWMASLRAPWCGLSLDDLETLSGSGRLTMWDRI
jgi:ATP-dependent helicase/nuclease subunit A